MTWFEALTGFPERSGDDVRSKIRLDGTRLTSLVNGREFDAGSFATPTLSDLRRKTKPRAGDRICVSETVGCVRALHADTANANAVFQVASQFNCLEMATPAITPEDGIGSTKQIGRKVRPVRFQLVREPSIETTLQM